MDTPTIISQYIKQVSERHYRGYLIIAGRRLNYELRIPSSVASLAKMEPAEHPEKTIIFLKRGRLLLAITKPEKLFFLHLCLIAVEELHHGAQKEGVVQKRSELAQTGVCLLGPENRQMLSQPKFGCKF